MTRIAFFLLALLAAPPVAAAPFNPVAFFRGRSQGEGVLKVIFQSAKVISNPPRRVTP